MFVHPENTGFPNSWTMITQMMEKNGHADAHVERLGKVEAGRRRYDFDMPCNRDRSFI